MDIRQLRYFIAIAEEKQITAAAHRLHMAQPPLGQQLKGMEQELGVQLVKRTGKSMELTDAGQALYRHALQLTKMLEESQIEVQEIGHGTRGKLTIGVNTLSSAALPKLLRIFQERYSQITYRIQQNESAQILRLIHERAIELGIVRLPLDVSEFEVMALRSEPFYFVRSNSHPFAGAPITYEDIEPYPLILPSTEGLGLYQNILEQFTMRGLRANVIGECSDIVTLLEWVSTGNGTTIVPASILQLYRGYDIQAVSITDSENAFATGLVWLKDRYLTKPAEHFIELMKKLERRIEE